jgi:hypothetical protein
MDLAPELACNGHQHQNVPELALALLQHGAKQVSALRLAVGEVVQQLRRRVFTLQEACLHKEALIKETSLALHHSQDKASNHRQSTKHGREWVSYSRLRSQNARSTRPPSKTVALSRDQSLEKHLAGLRFEGGLTAELLMRNMRCKLVLAVLFGARLVAGARVELAEKALWRRKGEQTASQFWLM